MTTHSERESIAARWLIEQDDPDFSDEQREELARWLMQSIENCSTYLRLVRAWRWTVLLRRNETPVVYGKRGATDASSRALKRKTAGPRTARAARDSAELRGQNARRPSRQSELHRQFGALLREYRYGRGLSQAELASRSGIDRTYISALESGKSSLTLTTMYVLARALEVSPSTLVSKLEKILARKSRPASR